IGGDVMVLVFIVIIVGGLGSVGGCFLGAILGAMTANYIAFLAPAVAPASTILLMVAVLMWRPQGLYPVAKREPVLASLFSGDFLRTRVLCAILLAIFVCLAVAPFAFSGAAAINTAAKICYFIVLVASYDLLLGYTGIVSFAHAMFFGIGGYGVGLALYGLDLSGIFGWLP